MEICNETSNGKTWRFLQNSKTFSLKLSMDTVFHKLNFEDLFKLTWCMRYNKELILGKSMKTAKFKALNSFRRVLCDYNTDLTE